MNPGEDIFLDDYKYELPDEKIAKYPLKDRDTSKLLYSDGQKVGHKNFKDISQLIQKDTLVVFNDTKVIPARIIFHKPTGARIEIFLLEPEFPSTVEEAMHTDNDCLWKCMIGNAKRWPIGSSQSLTVGFTNLTLKRTDENIIHFSWSDNQTFTNLIQELGKIPLPPYLNRQAEEEDKDRYQTVYSKLHGAVAAPTAGLHFTEAVLKDMDAAGIKKSFLTLHVSAGTFQPIKENNVVNHAMHREEIIITKDTLTGLLAANSIYAVGTTSLRTLESLYWYGVMLQSDSNAPFKIDKLYPYGEVPGLTRRQALENVLQLLKEQGIDQVIGNTEIFIFPGYQFRMIDGLITNFHQPGSTLILLIAAFIGKNWKNIYEEAKENNYRFLSYGDSCLFVKPEAMRPL